MLIDNREIPKGTKQKWNFVAAEMTVNRIEVPVTVINGAKDGPVLSITAGVHPNELIGQAADGFGEGLEQREIETDNGDIYVSFWHSGDDYFMKNETDFRQRMSENHSFEEQQLGGI